MTEHDTIEFQGRDWLWPKTDQKLRLVMDQVQVLAEALKQVTVFKTAIQAGGAMGVFPVFLANHFRDVWTFEPSNDNYFYLNHNTRGFNNIHPVRMALGNCSGHVRLTRTKHEQDNAGAYYTVKTRDRGVPQTSLDDFFTMPLDVGLIQLDVEGREYDVILGAQRIIESYMPVIVLENKSLPQDEEIGGGDAAKFLFDRYGYEVKARMFRDEILTV